MVRHLKPSEVAPALREVAARVRALPHFRVPDPDFCAVSWAAYAVGKETEAYAWVEKEKPTGILLGLVNLDWLTREKQALVFLWAGRGGLPLLRAFKRAAKLRGAERLLAGASALIEPRRMAKLYAKLGFGLHGLTFSKAL